MLSSSYYDEPTLPASPPPSSPPALPAVLSPPPASETQGQRVSVGPMRPLTRRQSAQQHQPQYQQVADVPSSSSVACGQPSGSCSSKGASGRPGRGKENIPPLSSSSSFSSSNSSNGNENAGPSNYASHAADDDDPMRGAGGAESDDGEAADELNIPRAASASSRPTLKRGRTPSMADLNGGGGEVNRRRLARSASSSSSSFSLGRLSPPTTTTTKSTSAPSVMDSTSATGADDDTNVLVVAPPRPSTLPTPTKPTTRRSAATAAAVDPVAAKAFPSPTRTTPERPPKRASAVRTRTLPEFTHANGQLATPPKTPAKARAVSAGPSPSKPSTSARKELLLKPSLYAKARALLRCSSTTLTTAAAAAAASKLAVPGDDDANRNGEVGGAGAALIGRSVEYTQLVGFLEPALAPPARSKAAKANPKTLYVAGPPGTGKTALVSRLADEQRQRGTTVGVVNCFTASAGVGGRAMWERVGEELFGEELDGWAKGAGREGVIDRLRQAKSRKFILILDELDSLVSVPVASSAGSSSSAASASTSSPSTLSPSVLLLQTLFRLPEATTNLALLAISNTLDFASRYLGTLPSPPETLAFAAYDAGQMSAIILDRLAGLTDDDDQQTGGAVPVIVIEDKAVELAARKVMAENGDLRLCLDVVRLAVELAEQEWKKACLIAAGSSGDTAAVVPIRKAGMTHVLKALQKAKAVACASSSPASTGLAASAIRTVDGVPRTPTKKTVNAGTVQKIQALNIQSRLVLVALVIHSRRASLGLPPLTATASPGASSSSSAVAAERTTSGALFSTYSHLLSSSDSPINALPPSDFHTVLALLADCALVHLSQASPAKRRGLAAGGPSPSSALVQLACLEDEVVKGLVGRAGSTGGGAEEEEARRILEREEGRMDRLRTRLGKERKLEKACALEDRL